MIVKLTIRVVFLSLPSTKLSKCMHYIWFYLKSLSLSLPFFWSLFYSSFKTTAWKEQTQLWEGLWLVDNPQQTSSSTFKVSVCKRGKLSWTNYRALRILQQKLLLCSSCQHFRWETEKFFFLLLVVIISRRERLLKFISKHLKWSILEEQFCTFYSLNGSCRPSDSSSPLAFSRTFFLKKIVFVHKVIPDGTK